MPLSRCRPPGRSPTPFSWLIEGLGRVCGDLEGGGAGRGGGTRCLVAELGGAVVSPVDLVQAPGGLPMRPAGPVGPSGGPLRPGGPGLASTTSAHQGACGARRGGHPPSLPVPAPPSSAPGAGGGSNTSRSRCRRSAMALETPRGPPWGRASPSRGPTSPHQGVCVPRRAAYGGGGWGAASPAVCCSPRRGPFVGLGDALGGPAGVRVGLSGGPAPPRPGQPPQACRLRGARDSTKTHLVPIALPLRPTRE